MHEKALGQPHKMISKNHDLPLERQYFNISNTIRSACQRSFEISIFTREIPTYYQHYLVKSSFFEIKNVVLSFSMAVFTLRPHPTGFFLPNIQFENILIPPPQCPIGNIGFTRPLRKYWIIETPIQKHFQTCTPAPPPF